MSGCDLSHDTDVRGGNNKEDSMIAIGSEHGGYDLKQVIIAYLKEK